MDLVEHELGPKALEYVRWCLRHGRALSQLLAGRLSGATGRITTLLPPGVGPAAREDFRAGGKLPSRLSEAVTGPGFVAVPIPTSKWEWAKSVRDYLAGGSDRIGVFENFLARKDDPVTAKFAPPIVLFGDEVYHLVVAGSAVETIVTSLDDAFSIPVFVGALTAARDTELPDPLHGSSIGRRQLETFARRTVAILVGAYDGEGFLIWRASQAE